MKISHVVKNSFNKVAYIGSAAILLGIGGASVYGIVDSYSKQKKAAKEYIRIHDPEKYNQLASGYTPFEVWKSESEKTREVVKLDSIAKTNYALGMQVVRDSLAQANKK